MKNLSISTESIAFQSGALIDALAACVQALRESARQKEDIAAFSSMVGKVIFEETGILVTTQLIDGWDNAAIMIPTLSPRHMLMSMRDKEYQNMYWENANKNMRVQRGTVLEGLVDAKTSKVSGYFSKVSHRMFLGSPYMLDPKYSLRLSAVAICHEIGHAFTTMQFLAEDIATNMVLAQTYQDLIKPENKGKVRMVLNQSLQAMDIKDTNNWIEAVEDKDAEVAFRVFCSAAVKELDNKNDHSRFYTMDQAEQLADIFVVRHGGARELIELRSMISDGRKDFIGQDGHEFRVGMMTTWSGLIALGMSVTSPILVAFAPLFMAISVVGTTILARGARSAASALTITSGVQEMAKIRNQMVQKLKELPLDRETMKDTLQTIELAEDRMKTLEDTTQQSFIVAFFDFFRRDKMNAKELREYTDRVERLATNDLFVRAAKLQSLS